MITVYKEDQDKFIVKVEEKEYIVGLDDRYWQDLTAGKITKEELIKKSFEFLLEREPKESILSRFRLQLINRYFPEFEKVIKQK